MGKSSSAPDPYATAAAQTQSNEQTANYNAALNRVSTYTPYGNEVYSQTGTDSTGAPTWRSDISLAPQAQQELDNELTQNNQISQLGTQLGNQIGTAINTPMSDEAATRQGAQNAYYANETQYLDPQYQQGQENLDSKLANQGIVAGSAANDRAQQNFDLTKQQAYSNAMNSAIGAGTTAQAEAISNDTNLRNEPVNELASLRSATPITNPTFPTSPTATAGQSNIEGDIYNSANIQNANANNMMNGMFSLGSAAIMASDRRLKRDIVRIGTTAVMRLPVYAFTYVWDRSRRFVGVMADEVAKVAPHAVLRDASGMALVDYAQVA